MVVETVGYESIHRLDVEQLENALDEMGTFYTVKQEVGDDYDYEIHVGLCLQTINELFDGGFLSKQTKELCISIGVDTLIFYV